MLDLPLACFLALVAISALASASPLRSFLPSFGRQDGVLTTALWIGGAALAARCTSADQRRILLAALGVGEIIAAVGIGQVYGYDAGALFAPPFHFANRAWGTMSNPNVFGAYLILVAPLALVLSPQALGHAFFALLAAGLAASQSRTAGLALGMVFAVLAYRRVVPLERLLWSAFFGGIAALILIVSTPAPRLTTQLASDTLESGGGRLYIARYVLPLIAQRPALGWGKNQLLGHIPSLHPTRTTAIIIDTAHNEPMQVAFESGLLGLGAYVWIWIVALRHAPPVIAAALLGYAVTLVLSWSQVGPANLAWILLGLAVVDVPHIPWSWAKWRRDLHL